MEQGRRDIRAIGASVLDGFMAYLEDHLEDNGRNGTALFQPQSRQTPGLSSEKIARFRKGLNVEVGDASWRRVWAAFDPNGAIAGHVDLRGHPEPCTSHRALLGLGVHRAHRNRGLGGALVAHAVQWALEETELAWIDLTFIGGNSIAERLYRSLGFQDLAVVPDMFRVDGASFDNIFMTRRIRPDRPATV